MNSVCLDIHFTFSGLFIQDVYLTNYPTYTVSINRKSVQYSFGERINVFNELNQNLHRTICHHRTFCNKYKDDVFSHKDYKFVSRKFDIVKIKEQSYKVNVEQMNQEYDCYNDHFTIDVNWVLQLNILPEYCFTTQDIENLICDNFQELYNDKETRKYIYFMSYACVDDYAINENGEPSICVHKLELISNEPNIIQYSIA